MSERYGNSSIIALCFFIHFVFKCQVQLHLRTFSRKHRILFFVAPSFFPPSSFKEADFLGQIRVEMSENYSTDVDSIDHLSGSDVNEGLCSLSSNASIPPKPSQASANSRSSKLKCCPASMGSVSSFQGKEYVKAKLSSFETATPLKLDAKLLSISDNHSDIQSIPIMEMQKEMEDFPLKMLEDSSQLNRDSIEEILGICGYDVKQSFEKLVEYSAIASNERSNLDGESLEKHRDISPSSEMLWPQKMFRDTKYAGRERRRLSQTKSAELTSQQMEKQNHEKEILTTLFCASKINDDEPRLTTGRRRLVFGNTGRRSTAFGLVVSPPPHDISPKDEAQEVDSNRENNDNDEEDAYEVLRRAVLEHRRTMRELYRAAVEAYANGDRALAEELLEQGRFHQKKARDADEESNEKIYETSGRNAGADDEFTLDLHQQDPKEAVSLLKRHLLSLPGIYSCLKVLIESNGADTSTGACKRRILKLLEKESIEWTEGETAGTILIALDKVQRECLSFYKKKSGNKFPC